ncbi:MAG: tetratricopeptide repeat protein [Opitutaceae bacterium]
MATARLPAWLRPALLAAAVVVAYVTALRAPFVFDDEAAVLRNPTIREFWSAEILRPPADGGTTTGRPLVNASLALDHALWGMDPAGFRATNFLIHLAATLVLFQLLRALLRGPVLGPRLGASAEGSAFFTALLWGVHPLQTESVTCIAQRTESLCGLLYLLTLLAVARHARSDVPRDTARRRWAVVAVSACAAGLAAKEVMVTAPGVALLLDRTFFAGTFRAAWRDRRGLHLGLAATWLVLAGLLFMTGGARGAAAGFDRGVSVWHYLLTQCEALALYTRLIAWPHPLVLDHGTAVVTSAAHVLPQGLLILAALGATGWALVRRPVAGFIGAAFFLLLAPSSSFVPLVAQTIAEHRMYLPLAAPLAAIVRLSVRLGRVRGWLLGAAVVALAGTTVARNRTYLDPVALWSSSVAGRSGNARAHSNLAVALRDAGRTGEARGHFARAIDLDPAYAPARYNRGVLDLAEGRFDLAEAEFAAALRIAPAHPDARLNLGVTLTRAGRAAEALPHFEEALRRKPGADVHFNLGIAHAALDRAEEAANHFRAALALEPDLAEAHWQLGRLAERAGRNKEARAAYDRVLSLDPKHAEAHRRLGLLAARHEDFTAAERHFTALATSRPDDADAHANLGNVLLLTGRAKEAVERFEAALRLRPGDERLRESLATARRSGS